MKTNKNILNFLPHKMVMCLIFSFFNFTISSQTELNFNNGLGDGLYIRGGTGAGTIGAVYFWNNVGVESGVIIDAEIEIISIFGGATLTSIDGSSNPQDWEPQISGPSTSDGDSYGIEFQVRFLDQSTGLPYTLSSFLAQAIDVDGGGTGSALREFTTFLSPSNYLLETPTELTASMVTNGIKFKSSQNLFSGISIGATEYIASCTYTGVSEFNVVCGVVAEGGTSSGNRLYSMNFRDVVSFDSPVSPLPIKLSHFIGKNIGGNKVMIQWETKTEKNIDFFTLERLDKDKNSRVVSVVKSSGNSNLPIVYNSYDYVAPDAIVYYRLKQTTLDDLETYSNIISVINKKSTNETIRKINLMGSDLVEGEKGVVLIIYENEEVVKTIQR